ncbi:hypothetical protein BDQ12DRAFT_669813 [Crucibulum laeve]|uniref:Uncharacterized protein n=1 Tax=Crucibulum laeve TaxID=68775 RepID=A0A5C3LMQ6_9AGAR|nr:hypothetical protein BDQ12DRAFT_669813 [Crucibulum laeve]
MLTSGINESSRRLMVNSKNLSMLRSMMNMGTWSTVTLLERLENHLQSRHPLPDGDSAHIESADEDDEDYSGLVEFTDSESDLDSDLEMDVEMTNEELANSLPAKLVPSTKAAKCKHAQSAAQFSTKKGHQVNTEAAEDTEVQKTNRTRVADDNDNNPTKEKSQNKTIGKQNPIYYFYEAVVSTEDGVSIPGNKYYKCLYGNNQIFTVTKAMKYSLNGLLGNLKTKFPAMYKLYLILKAHPTLPTEDEIAIASGKKVLNVEEASKYIMKLESALQNIIYALEQQAIHAAGEFKQDVFEDLLAKWIVACDQLFDEVEKPELQALLDYVHHKPVKIPGRTTIQTCIMKMGEDTVESVKDIFSKLESKVSISLDAWTSQNQIAFLALVAHDVTNDGKLGENMADTVWKTLELYGLTNKSIENQCFDNGIEFSLLENVGALTDTEEEKAASRSGTYQDAATALVD